MYRRFYVAAKFLHSQPQTTVQIFIVRKIPTSLSTFSRHSYTPPFHHKILHHQNHKTPYESPDKSSQRRLLRNPNSSLTHGSPRTSSFEPPFRGPFIADLPFETYWRVIRCTNNRSRKKRVVGAGNWRDTVFRCHLFPWRSLFVSSSRAQANSSLVTVFTPSPWGFPFVHTTRAVCARTRI